MGLRDIRSIRVGMTDCPIRFRADMELYGNYDEATGTMTINAALTRGLW